MIIVAGLLVFCASLFITAALRPPNKPAFVLSLYLLSYANIVLAGLIANSFLVLNQQWAFISLHFAFSVVSVLVWWRTGRPPLLGPFANWKKELANVRNSLKTWPDLILLGFGILAAFALATILILVVPPNNNDSLSTYLSRAGYWLQHGSFFPWPTSRVYQISFPVNAQLQFFWTILFWGTDRLAGFVQWTAGLAAIAAVFGLARLLGWNRPQSAFAALIYASFPQTLLQITSTQNDLVTAALFISTIYFLLLGLQSRQRGMLALSGLSLGLGFGTKQTLYFLLPGLGVLVLLAWRKFGLRVWKELLYWGIACIIGFALFAAYINVMNTHTFGNPFGPSDIVERQVGGKDLEQIVNNVRYNVPRLLYQSIDTCGLPRPLDGYAHKVKARVARAFFNAIGFSIEGDQYTGPGYVFSLDEKTLNQEDFAWYGPLSALLLFPAVVYQFIFGIRSREPVRIGLVLNALIFLLIIAFIRPGWEAYQGRYFLPVVTLNAPLMASLFPSKPRAGFLRYAAVGLALMITTVTMLYNPAKPVAGKRATWVDIWSADRITLQTLQGRPARDMLRLVEEYVPADATLGLYTPGYVLDYLLFGEHFTRRLIPIYPFERIADAEWLKAQGIEYVLLQKRGESLPTLAEGLKKIKGSAGWIIYTWEDD